MDQANYQRLVEAEKQIYTGERPSASIPAIFTYWASRYLSPRMRRIFGTPQIEGFFASEIARGCRGISEFPWRILSLGSGECSLEVEIAKHLDKSAVDFRLTCTDISPRMLEAGKRLVNAARFGERFAFVECDINSAFPKGPWHAVIANHCLHHFVELEYIFENLRSELAEEGCAIISDMIGRNGHMRWPEVLSVVSALWDTLPPAKRVDRINRIQRTDFVNFDCAAGTLEGIRSQDILPLMLDRFHFERFLAYGGVPDIFVDRMYGPNFDVNSTLDVAFIDLLETVNDRLLKAGVIKPTMMFATVRCRETQCLFEPVHPYGAVRMPNWP